MGIAIKSFEFLFDKHGLVFGSLFDNSFGVVLVLVAFQVYLFVVLKKFIFSRIREVIFRILFDIRRLVIQIFLISLLNAPFAEFDGIQYLLVQKFLYV